MIKILLFLLFISFPAKADFVPKIQDVIFKDKYHAYLLEDNKYPVIALSLYFNTGYVDDEKGGISELFVSLLDEGAGKLKAKEFQDILYDNGIELSFNVSDEILTVSLQCLKEKRDLAFKMLKMALFSPRFDDDAIKRMKDSLIASIRYEAKNQSKIAMKEWKKHALKHSVYRKNALENEETLNKITKKDLISYQKERLALDNLYIGASGAISQEELKSELETMFSLFNPKSKALKREKTKVDLTENNLKIFYDSPQTVIVFGQDGISRLDKDYYPAVILNYVLGSGGFSSRLFSEIREKRGLVYGISTWFSVSDFAPLLMGYVGTREKNANEAIEVIKSEWQKMKTDGISEAELASAKKYLLGSFPFKFSSSLLIAKILSSIQIQNLGLNYFNDYIKGISDVTVDDVKRVAKDLLDENKLLFTIAGKN